MFIADDDSDVNPHDFDGCGSDHEYGGSSTHLNIGQHSFSQMQVCVIEHFHIIFRWMNINSGDFSGWSRSATFTWQSSTCWNLWKSKWWWWLRGIRTSRKVRETEFLFSSFAECQWWWWLCVIISDQQTVWSAQFDCSWRIIWEIQKKNRILCHNTTINCIYKNRKKERKKSKNPNEWYSCANIRIVFFSSLIRNE